MEEGLRLRHRGKEAVMIALSSSKIDVSPVVHSSVCVPMSLLRSQQQCQISAVSLNPRGKISLHPIASRSVNKGALSSSDQQNSAAAELVKKEMASIGTCLTSSFPASSNPLSPPLTYTLRAQ